MRAFILLTLLFLAGAPAKSQSTTVLKPEYITWLYLYNNNRPLKGAIVATNDSSLQFLDASYFRSRNVAQTITPTTYPVSAIEKIKIRKRGRPGRGAIIGAIGGSATGALLGYISGDDECEPGSWCILEFSAEQKAGIGATLGGVSGFLIGALHGSGKQTIRIEGNQNLYFNSREELNGYSLTAK